MQVDHRTLTVFSMSTVMPYYNHQIPAQGISGRLTGFISETGLEAVSVSFTLREGRQYFRAAPVEDKFSGYPKTSECSHKNHNLIKSHFNHFIVVTFHLSPGVDTR